jgi:hypothetical protein
LLLALHNIEEYILAIIMEGLDNAEVFIYTCVNGLLKYNNSFKGYDK